MMIFAQIGLLNIVFWPFIQKYSAHLLPDEWCLKRNYLHLFLFCTQFENLQRVSNKGFSRLDERNSTTVCPGIKTQLQILRQCGVRFSFTSAERFSSRHFWQYRCASGESPARQSSPARIPRHPWRSWISPDGECTPPRCSAFFQPLSPGGPVPSSSAHHPVRPGR